MFNDIESKFQSAFGSTYKMGKLLSDGSFTVRDAVDINKDVYIQARPPMKENPLSFNGDNPILTGTNKITDPATPGATYSIIVDGERYSATDDPTITDVDTMLAALVKESDGTNLTGTSGTHKIYTINNNKYISTDDLLVPIDDSTSTSNPKVKFSNFNNSGNSDINVSDKDGFGIQDAVYKLTIDGVDYSFTDTNSDIGNGADMMANIKDSSGKTLLENGYIYPKDSANGFCIMKNNTIVGEGLVGSNSYENAVYNVEQAGARMLQTNTIVSNSGTLPDTIDLNLDRLGVSENPYGEFSVDENGELSILQNGATVVVGKLAVARFTSNTGLTPIGNNQYRATLESGKAIYATASQMPMIQGQSLEVSNADLSESLINMIIYQRAFEASAKTITTSDELLTTLLGMKR
jgi:flagellar hook protein FlgE